MLAHVVSLTFSTEFAFFMLIVWPICLPHLKTTTITPLTSKLLFPLASPRITERTAGYSRLIKTCWSICKHESFIE